MRRPPACGEAAVACWTPAVLDSTRLNRIRWRCRRGMLENDLVLTRFLDERGPALSESEVVLLDRLLDLADNELWDLIAGRADPQDPAVATVLQQLRTA
jgi:antitoxin CptB